MRFSSAAVAVCAATSALAAPLAKRADAPPGGDITILQYALTLEYLERAFYREALSNYTQEDFANAGFNQTMYNNFQSVYEDEQSHVAFLAGALGDSAVHEGNYSFPVTDVKSFIGLSAVIEGVGTSAYLGAAGSITDKTYIPIAGSILTVEARHTAYIRSILGQSPAPKAYDTPLDFNSVFSLAAQFIVSLPADDPKLPFQPFPVLTVAPSSDGYKVGSEVRFTGAASLQSASQLYAVIYSGLDVYYVPTQVCESDLKISLPDADVEAGQLAPAGQVYVVLSTANGNDTMVADTNVVSGVGILEVAA